MSRKWWAVTVVAVLAVVAVTVGIATSRAQGDATLQNLSVAQLLAKVADAPKTTSAISGDISWSNGLIPGSDLTGLLSGQSSAPTSLSGLALGGSGRLWMQQGGGMRLEAQGSGSDFVVVAGKDGIWSYSSATNTASARRQRGIGNGHDANLDHDDSGLGAGGNRRQDLRSPARAGLRQG